jgi:hypothetical protein
MHVSLVLVVDGVAAGHNLKPALFHLELEDQRMVSPADTATLVGALYLYWVPAMVR